MRGGGVLAFRAVIKAWFPYDRPDHPSRLKKCSDDRDNRQIANDPDDQDDLDRLDRVEFYPDDRDDHVNFEAIIWKRPLTTETIGTIKSYPRSHHIYSSNRE